MKTTICSKTVMLNCSKMVLWSLIRTDIIMANTSTTMEMMWKQVHVVSDYSPGFYLKSNLIHFACNGVAPLIRSDKLWGRSMKSWGGATPMRAKWIKLDLASISKKSRTQRGRDSQSFIVNNTEFTVRSRRTYINTEFNIATWSYSWIKILAQIAKF